MLNYIDNNGRPDPSRFPYPNDKLNLEPTEAVKAVEEKFSESKERESANEAVFFQVFKRANNSKNNQNSFFKTPAKNIMTKKVVTLEADTSIEQAWEYFKKYSFRHMPVVDADSHVIGMVSYKSLSKNLFELEQNSPERKNLVSEIMISNVLVSNPDTALNTLALNLINKKIGAMPIVDAENKINGIVTRSDVLKAVFIPNSAIDLRV